jgi:hypothetical protein
MAKTIPEQKARQGRWGWHALAILVVGLILAFVIWGLVEIYGRAIEPPGGGTVGMMAPSVQGVMSA